MYHFDLDEEILDLYNIESLHPGRALLAGITFIGVFSVYMYYLLKSHST